MSATPTRLHQELQRLMQARDWAAAERLCAQLTRQFPSYPAGWQAASRVALAQGDPAGALARIERLLALTPAEPRALIARAQCLLALGRLPEAVAAAATAQGVAAKEPVLLDAIGGVFNLANDQERALAAYDAAVALAPDNPHFLFNRAAVRRFVGQFAAAESDYDRAIALRPDDHEAYLNRSALRTQTAERNHVAQLQALLVKPPADWRGEVQLRFALAKEYEDLGEYGPAFRQLELGARKRREFLRYDVATDVATVDWIIEAFPAGPAAPTPQADESAPIFIVGLPRSGTTLVERILGSHSAIHAAGELNYFALCVVDAVRRLGGPAQLPRRDLVARSAGVDFAALGRQYLARVRAAGIDAPRFTDKMPLNYLYCGLIHRALPRAPIVHLTRHPLAVCYAMYKTLFKDGYPFSYDLSDIARYYGAYRRLMDHWRRTMPGAIYDVSYEAVVTDQVGETRKLLAHCGLEWEDACADFHRNPSASTTASAAQVRRPVYSSSVELWRRYEAELAPLAEGLKEFL